MTSYPSLRCWHVSLQAFGLEDPFVSCCCLLGAPLYVTGITLYTCTTFEEERNMKALENKTFGLSSMLFECMY